MKTLLIMRHGKSSWKDETLSDHDRPLAKRGRLDVPKMGAFIQDQDIVPEIILSSTAKRARETAELFAEATRFDGSIYFHRSIYHGDTSDYFDLLQTLDSGHRIAMIVGHNPGLEELISNLVDSDEWMPTSSIARIDLDIDSWQVLNEFTTGVLIELWRPRELN